MNYNRNMNFTLHLMRK